MAIPKYLLAVSPGNIMGVHFNGESTNPKLYLETYNGVYGSIPDYVNGVPKHKFRYGKIICFI